MRPAEGAEPVQESVLIYLSQPSVSLSESPKGPIAVGLAVVLLFFAGLGGWAGYAPLNGAVIAPAVIKVEGSRKTIQHLDGGIVKELRIKGGITSWPVSSSSFSRTCRPALHAISSRRSTICCAHRKRVYSQNAIACARLHFPADLMARYAEPEIAKVLGTETRQFHIRRTGLEGQTRYLDPTHPAK